MAECCNTCGAFEGVDKCDHCPTLICPRCKLRHEPFCKEIQKMKARGQGPTIANVSVPQHRAGHEMPPTTGPDRPSFIPAASVEPIGEIDQALNTVKDLLAE